MIMNNEINLKIATLNLNGETFWSINRRPRLPQDLFNIKEIKKALVDKITEGLKNILNKGTYDIIAIQELLNICKYYNDIKDVIEGKVEEKAEEKDEENGYRLIIPENLRKNTHFTVGFIVKKGIEIKNIPIENIETKNTPIENNVLKEISNNKKIFCEFTKNGISYKILNVHLTEHTDGIKNDLLDFLNSNNDDNNVIRILLGDFNAYNDEQKKDKVQCCNNAEFINGLMEKDFRENSESTNENYTFWASGWKKLDHIFISGKNIDVKETVNNNVNFYPIENETENTQNNNEGFTDHSMLIADIKGR